MHDKEWKHLSYSRRTSPVKFQQQKGLRDLSPCVPVEPLVMGGDRCRISQLVSDEKSIGTVSRSVRWSEKARNSVGKFVQDNYSISFYI